MLSGDWRINNNNTKMFFSYHIVSFVSRLLDVTAGIVLELLLIFHEAASQLPFKHVPVICGVVTSSSLERFI